MVNLKRNFTILPRLPLRLSQFPSEVKRTFLDPFANQLFKSKDAQSLEHSNRSTGKMKKRAQLIRNMLHNKKLSRGIIRLDKALIENSFNESKEHKKKIKLSFLLENYKYRQRKRIHDLIENIDVTEPYIIPALFNYKMREIKEEEAESYQVVKRYREMINDPRREVAKIEKNRLSFPRLKCALNKRSLL